MKTAKLILIISFVSCFNFIKAQESNKYLLSILDGKEYEELSSFLIGKGEMKNEDKSKSFIFKRELLNDSLGFNIGIYKFGIPGSHQVSYVYFLCNEGKKKFIEDYSVESIIKSLNKFYKKNNKLLTEDNKISYLKELSIFIQNRSLQVLNSGNVTISK